MYYLEDKFEAFAACQGRLAGRLRVFRHFNGLNWLATLCLGLTFLPFWLFSLLVLLPFWLYERIELWPDWIQVLTLLTLVHGPLALGWLCRGLKTSRSDERRSPWTYAASLMVYWTVALPFGVVLFFLLIVPLVAGLFLHTMYAGWLFETQPAAYALAFTSNLALSWLALRRDHNCTAPNAVRYKCPGRWARGWSIVSILLVLATPWVIDTYRSVLRAAFNGW